MTPLFRYRDFDRRVAFVNAQLEKIRAIPGVVSAGAISRIPLTVTTSRRSTCSTVSPERRYPRPGRALARRHARLLRHGRRAPARRPVLRARPTDGRTSPVAIVNESFANRHFPGRSPLGARFKFGRLGDKGYWYTIVGVVKEIRERGVAEELRPAVYRVHEQSDQTGDEPSGIVIRTAVEPASIVAGGPAGDLVGRQEPADRARPDHRGHRRPPAVGAVAEHGAAGRVRAARAAARVARALRRALLRGDAAHQRNRRAHGARARRPATSCVAFGRRGLALTLAGLAIGVGLAAVAARLMTALFYGFRPDYLPAVAVVSPDPPGGGRPRVSRSRAPRLAHRSDRRPAAGIGSSAPGTSSGRPSM